MNRGVIGIFICMLLIVTIIPTAESLYDSKLNPGVQNISNNYKIQDSISNYSTFIFGEITNLHADDGLISFQAVNIKVITFRPFSFNPYSSGEYFEISNIYKGFIGVHFIFALVNEYITKTPEIAFTVTSYSDKIFVTMAESNIKWKNIDITTNNTDIAWRVFSDSTPVDGWNSTAYATADVTVGDYVFFQFNKTTPNMDVEVTFRYIPTNDILTVLTINV